MNYTTQRWDDDQTVEMKFRVEVCDGYVEFERGKNWTGNPSSAIEQISKIRGIQRVRSQGYKLLVEKGRAFEWHEIQPEIDRIAWQFLQEGQPS